MAVDNVADLLADLNLDALEIEESEPVTQETLVMRMGIPVGEPGALYIKVVDRGRSHNLERIHPLSSVAKGRFFIAKLSGPLDDQVLIYPNIHYPECYLRACHQNNPEGVFGALTVQELTDIAIFRGDPPWENVSQDIDIWIHRKEESWKWNVLVTVLVKRECEP